MKSDPTPTAAAPCDAEPHAGPTRPQHCGSDEALAVLRALRDWHVPCGHADSLALTGLDNYALRSALQGLKTRRAVDCDQRGPHARWHVLPRRCDETIPGQRTAQPTGRHSAQRSAA